MGNEGESEVEEARRKMRSGEREKEKENEVEEARGKMMGGAGRRRKKRRGKRLGG